MDTMGLLESWDHLVQRRQMLKISQVTTGVVHYLYTGKQVNSSLILFLSLYLTRLPKQKKQKQKNTAHIFTKDDIGLM